MMSADQNDVQDFKAKEELFFRAFGKHYEDVGEKRIPRQCESCGRVFLFWEGEKPDWKKCKSCNVAERRAARGRSRNDPLCPSGSVGVYFLMKNDDLLYVGKTTDIDKRIRSHQDVGAIPFSSVMWMPVQEKHLSEVETFWISLLRPPYNWGGKYKRIRVAVPKIDLPLDHEDVKRLEKHETDLISHVVNMLVRSKINVISAL
jgi:hypothetical protein